VTGKDRVAGVNEDIAAARVNANHIGGFMHWVFLIVRMMFGGYFAWTGSRYLSPYGREVFTASLRGRRLALPAYFIVVTSGLLLLVGGVSIALGVPAGSVLLALPLLGSIGLQKFWLLEDPAERRVVAIRFWRNLGAAFVALMFLAVPGVWAVALLG
jgi:hypothetical protein